MLANSDEIAIKQMLLNRDVIQNLPKEGIVFMAACFAKDPPAWQDFS
jgi:hypothetical protein